MIGQRRWRWRRRRLRRRRRRSRRDAWRRLFGGCPIVSSGCLGGRSRRRRRRGRWLGGGRRRWSRLRRRWGARRRVRTADARDAHRFPLRFLDGGCACPNSTVSVAAVPAFARRFRLWPGDLDVRRAGDFLRNFPRAVGGICLDRRLVGLARRGGRRSRCGVGRQRLLNEFDGGLERQTLCLKERRRHAAAFADDGRKHDSAIDFRPSALARGGFGVAEDLGEFGVGARPHSLGKWRELLLADERRDLIAQPRKVDVACCEHTDGVVVLGERQQEMLEGDGTMHRTSRIVGRAHQRCRQRPGPRNSACLERCRLRHPLARPCRKRATEAISTHHASSDRVRAALFPA